MQDSKSSQDIPAMTIHLTHALQYDKIDFYLDSGV